MTAVPDKYDNVAGSSPKLRGSIVEWISKRRRGRRVPNSSFGIKRDLRSVTVVHLRTERSQCLYVSTAIPGRDRASRSEVQCHADPRPYPDLALRWWCCDPGLAVLRRRGEKNHRGHVPAAWLVGAGDRKNCV